VPAFGKTGSALYEAACQICHDTTHRNEMVPDLNIARTERDYEYWKTWIANGKDGSLMPAFAKEHGGPLTDAQIMSLAHYLSRTLARSPVEPVGTTTTGQ
jgi:mono/diheme cytochrome c family protein